MVPGTRAFAFVARWFDPSTVSSVFEPLIADWQREWRDAAGLARIGVRIRGGAALSLSMIAASPNVLLAPWPVSTLRRVITRLMIWTSVITALTMAPFVIDLQSKIDLGVFPYLLVFLMPQAVAIAFPCAITTIVDLIRTAPESNREERIAAMKVAIASVTLMLILCGWAFPAANQQYRVTASRAVMGATRNFGPARGLHELSIVELVQDDRLVAQRRPSGDPIYDAWMASRAGAEPVLREISQRFSLILLPIALIWMRWRALRLPRGRWYSALPLLISAPVTVLLFYSLLAQSRALADVLFAPRWSGPLLAPTLMIVGALVIDRARQAGLKTRLYAQRTNP